MLTDAEGALCRKWGVSASQVPAGSTDVPSPHARGPAGEHPWRCARGADCGDPAAERGVLLGAGIPPHLEADPHLLQSLSLSGQHPGSSDKSVLGQSANLKPLAEEGVCIQPTLSRRSR